MNKQTISQDQEAPPQPYLVSSVFSSTIYKTLGTRIAIPITPRESSHVLQNPTKMIFFCQEIFFFNLRSSEQKIQEHGKGALLFSSFLFFHFFHFLVLFIFHFLVSHFTETGALTERCTCSGRKPLLLTWHPLILLPFSKYYTKVRLPFSIMVSPVKSVLLKNI